MQTWAKVAIVGAGIGIAAFVFRGRRSLPRVFRPAVAPADIEAAIRETARESVGGENEELERALLAWVDLESGFNANTIVQAATGRAMGLFQLLDRFFLPLAIERALLPAGARAEDLLIPVVNVRLGVENVVNLLNHEDNPGSSFRARFLAARSRALGCDFRCECEAATCARVTRRGIAALDKWGVA